MFLVWFYGKKFGGRKNRSFVIADLAKGVLYDHLLLLKIRINAFIIKVVSYQPLLQLIGSPGGSLKCKAAILVLEFPNKNGDLTF